MDINNENIGEFLKELDEDLKKLYTEEDLSLIKDPSVWEFSDKNGRNSKKERNS